MALRPITSLGVKGKKVLVRCDFNVPLSEGEIADPARIDSSLETIRYIIAQGGAAVLCSHLGRPKERTAEMSLKPVAEYLSKVLARRVRLAPDCVGEVTGGIVAGLGPGDALLLENLRFHREEAANDRDFAHEHARGKQAYVNDAFGAAHRAHASTAAVVRHFPEHAAGFLMMRELEALRAVTGNPARPYVAILGGAKVSDKIGVLRNLLPKVDAILVGGAMAYTFMKARRIEVGQSRVEDDKLALAGELMVEADNKRVRILLPTDHVVANSIDDEHGEIVSQISPAKIALDIGPHTIDEFIAAFANAKTVIWNGPLGLFERPQFANGTLKVGEALARLDGATTLIGGGDTAAAVASHPWAARFTHISTGGGATLEYLEGRELPGVKALEQ
ncbi:MAG: phosphoglycerate kinase [Candidatus Binataceae bacterium]